jgi:hypothetical protein
MPDQGVQFPMVDGRRSTQRTGRDVFAVAAAAVDPGLAAEIRAERSWRTAYPRHLRHLTEVAAFSPDAGLSVARAGLDRVHATFEHTDGVAAMPVPAAVATDPGVIPPTHTVAGTGERDDELVIPVHGRDLRGDALLATIDGWVARGVAEPPLRAAIEDLVERPGWLDLRGSWFGVLGAGAEMAPTAQLLRWGADIAAVDLPRGDVWDRLEHAAVAGNGRLHAPVSEDGRPPGADLTVAAPAVRAWLASLDQPLVLGNYGYADGATFARLSVAADAVIANLLEHRDDHGVVCLATPTDVFAVPAHVATATRARTHGISARTLAPVLRAASVGRLLQPNHRTTVRTSAGDEVGIADSLVLQQGPNYAFAKRLQRWRALTAHADGRFAAVHVAPPTRTRSVVKNRVLAAAYGGASLFGVEVFAPETSSALMAALLVHDLRMHAAGSAPKPPTDEHVLTAAAAHGGLWRVAWETRTAFPLAILRGAPALLRSG